MNKALRITLVILLVLLLVGIRMFEDTLFYDPLLQFFKTDHTIMSLPEMDTFKMVISTTFRYLLNSALSLALLYVLFQKGELIKLAASGYMIFGLLLLIIFLGLLNASEAGNHMVLFYVRRFLIQPILLLIFIPAFYFYRK